MKGTTALARLVYASHGKAGQRVARLVAAWLVAAGLGTVRRVKARAAVQPVAVSQETVSGCSAWTGVASRGSAWHRLAKRVSALQCAARRGSPRRGKARAAVQPVAASKEDASDCAAGQCSAGLGSVGQARA